MTSIRSVRNEDIRSVLLQTLDVDLQAPPPQKSEDAGELRILRYQQSLSDIVSPESCSGALLLSSHTTSGNDFFVSACVHLHGHDELYLTSAPLPSSSASKPPQVLISRVALLRADATVDDPTPPVVAAVWQKMRAPPSMPDPAGACAYEDGVVYCAQNTSGHGGDKGGLVYMPRSKMPPQVVSRYGGRPFSSPQRVAKSPADGSLWFTTDASADTHAAATNGFVNGAFTNGNASRPRTPPSLVYRHDNRDGSTRVMADGFVRPGAIAFSRDGTTAYISDAKEGEQDYSPSAPTIYAFDVIVRHGQPFLGNKRVFAVPFDGAAADIQCDVEGNVFAACGDGVEIWSPGGVPLGLIEIYGGCSCLCFGTKGELFIGAGQRLWRVQF